MARNHKWARTGAAVVGSGAIVVAAVIPGTLATAETTGSATVDVTRAVLIQGNADAEINRATLITQINVDGQGQATFTVPTVEGGSPKNMDSFGGPEVVDGQAQYDIAVDGSSTQRTSQSFDPNDIPVGVSVEATLDGQPMKLSELAGQSGLATITYTFENKTLEPTQLTYEDAKGNTITEEREIPVPMGGSVDITFPESWGEVSAPKASTVSGDGTGNTVVSGTVALMPDSLPDQSPTATFEIEARLTDAVVPPADIKFAVLPPDTSPDLLAGRKTAEEGTEQAASITDAGVQLEDGGGQLQTGLATAADGARQIADGVSGQLGPGVTQLSEGLNAFYNVAIVGTLVPSAENLPQTVVSDPSFSELTDGFDAVNSAIDGVKDGMGTYKSKSSQKPGSWLTKSGDVDTDRADVARTLWSLVYGVRSKDIPTDGSNSNTIPNTNNGGLTNPDCDYDDPKSATNPCGAWQVIDVVKENNTKLSGGTEAASKALTDPKSGGAFALKALANSLGCDTSTPAGYTGPVVGPAVGLAGNPCGEVVTVGGSANCPNPFQDLLPLPTLPCNLVINALLGGVDLTSPVTVKMPGLTQSIFAPLKLEPDGTTPSDESGLAALLGTFYPIAFATLNDGLTELQRNVTTKVNGMPDLDTTKENTATGIVMQTRSSLAFGGVGSDLYPAGRCEGYAVTGDPSSGLNENADADRVEATCGAGDVLRIALYGTGAIQEGVETTLLEGISETLLEGIGAFTPGCEPTATLACAAGTLAAGGVQLNEGVNGPNGLAYGTNLLADGLPAAVDGAGKIADGGKQLAKAGNDGSKTAGLAIATLDALQSRVDSGAGVPGGAPEGATSFGGVYAFALDGAGGTATENAARGGLALLALIAAGGIGAVLGNRASG